MNRLAVLAVPTALLALALSGCGSKETGSPVPVQNENQNQPGTSAAATDTKEDTSAAADVKITQCLNKSYGQDVTLEVTNSTAQDQRYVVGVNITDAAGGKSEARFAKNRMTPGQTITEKIPGDTPLKGEIKCEIGEAKRLPPK